MREPPLVAIEIASPTQATQDLADKIRQMLAAGVQSCWLVQPPMQAITIYTDRRCAAGVFGRPARRQGPLEDPATGIEIDGAEVFASA
jgi:Uma2 family endonuclease